MMGGGLAWFFLQRRFLRYGSLHANTIGLEVVLADGTVLDMLSPCRKDNTGLHLPHLFIGAEGTLGVVTAAALAVPQRSKAVNVAFLSCLSWEAVLEVVYDCVVWFGLVWFGLAWLDPAWSRYCDAAQGAYSDAPCGDPVSV